MNATDTVTKFQARASMLFAELQNSQELPKQAKRTRKELDSIIHKIYSHNHLGL